MAKLKTDWRHEKTPFGQIEKVTLQNGDGFGAPVSGPHTFKSLDEAIAFVAGVKAATELLT